MCTLTISLPACAKNARSSRWKYPLVGPERMFNGGGGGKRAMSSCPVGGAGYFRGGMFPRLLRSTSANPIESETCSCSCVIRRRDLPRSDDGDNGLRGRAPDCEGTIWGEGAVTVCLPVVGMGWMRVDEGGGGGVRSLTVDEDEEGEEDLSMT